MGACHNVLICVFLNTQPILGLASCEKPTIGRTAETRHLWWPGNQRVWEGVRFPARACLAKSVVSADLASSGSAISRAQNCWPSGLCPVCGVPADTVCSLCGDAFCATHIYVCLDCAAPLCGGCSDQHAADGHWDDSDTARERFASVVSKFASTTGGGR
jgi:hypothetical protein